jgi:hypothetical protein
MVSLFWVLVISQLSAYCPVQLQKHVVFDIADMINPRRAKGLKVPRATPEARNGRKNSRREILEHGFFAIL